MLMVIMLMNNNKKKKNLLRRGNITLLRLLITVNAAGSQGITTMNLFRQLGTTGYGQDTLSRAEKQGLIKRETGESEHGQFPPVYNKLTEKGRRLLLSQMPG
jgi:DNA-binding MarR family transcriptional regulator